MAKLKITPNPYSIFRIHRTEKFKDIGLGEKGDYFETFVFRSHLKKHNLIGGIIGKAHLAATQFREVNKGYARGFRDYRTYNEREQIRRFGVTQEERDKRKHVQDLKL